MFDTHVLRTWIGAASGDDHYRYKVCVKKGISDGAAQGFFFFYLVGALSWKEYQQIEW